MVAADIPEVDASLRPATIYRDDGTKERVYIIDQRQSDKDQSIRQHYRISQIYMIASTIAIVITSCIAIIQFHKLKS